MMKKLYLAIVAASGIAVIGISTQLFAEGNHTHTHAKSNHGEVHWASPKDASERTNPIKSDKDSIARGAKSYATLCISCHGEKALGDGVSAAFLDPKPTNLKAMSGRHKDGDFAWKISNGRGAMPAWKAILSENNIWDLVNFIQDLSSVKKKISKNKHNHKH